ncbi:MAG: zeta toxin family protein [Janthinobacterium lividum]
MDTDDRRISDEAVVFAKANRKEIARRLTDPLVYVPDDCPVSIFMAGSPGAGKTETSIEFMNRFESSTVRIDPDLLRAEIPTYTGGNAYLFQHAVSVLVEKLHDQALKQKQSFLLKRTLSDFVRNATFEEKERVYLEVMEKAWARQEKIIEQARKM